MAATASNRQSSCTNNSDSSHSKWHRKISFLDQAMKPSAVMSQRICMVEGFRIDQSETQCKSALVSTVQCKIFPMECMIVLTSKVAQHCLALLHENISWCTTVDAKTNIHAHSSLIVPLLCIQESKSHTYMPCCTSKWNYIPRCNYITLTSRMGHPTHTSPCWHNCT